MQFQFDIKFKINEKNLCKFKTGPFRNIEKKMRIISFQVYCDVILYAWRPVQSEK